MLKRPLAIFALALSFAGSALASGYPKWAVETRARAIAHISTNWSFDRFSDLVYDTRDNEMVVAAEMMFRWQHSDRPDQLRIVQVDLVHPAVLVDWTLEDPYSHR